MKNLKSIVLVTALLAFALNLSAETQGSTETSPSVAKKVAPQYPADALILGEQGMVEVELLVSPQGDVLAVGTMGKTDHPALAKAAIAAIKKWEFASRETETNQPYMVKVPVNFTIADDGRSHTTQVAAK